MTKTYAQLAREIASLQATAEKLRAAEIKAAVAKANELIAAYGLTADDLKFSKSTSVRTARAKATTSDARYSDGMGHTWGGRGPRPAWLREALATGQTLQSYETGAVSNPAGKKAKAAKKSGYKVAIKYRDAATGNSWSGRGSQPAWLKTALKKRGSKIADFLVDAQATSSSGAVSRQSATTKVARKGAAKAGATKTAAKEKSAVAGQPSKKPRLSRKQASAGRNVSSGAAVDRLSAPSDAGVPA